MSRDLNPLAKLNTVDGKNEDKLNEAELQMFSDTHFFDLDIGRSTDIATTVDELLMQQEKQIQYPQKQQPYEDLAGPSYNPNQPPSYQHSQTLNQQQIPFDLTTFSLAEELPQTSLSILDIDPLFHHSTPQTSTRTHERSIDLEPVGRNTRHPPMQRHELADLYAPKPASSTNKSSSSPEQSLGGVDDEKRRRNTAASARFRVKKKLREQEMEKNLKALQQKLSDQEDRIKQLEMENTWLKNLVVEKNTERETSSLGKLKAQYLNN